MGKILHIDCDCFFAAVEMRDHPEYHKVPIAIGGSRDRRGVISTCNYPARRFGVHSAMATSQALNLCPELILLNGNMSLYRQVSKQVMAIISGYGDQCQVVSIDEAYVKLTDDDDAVLIARLIKEQVKQLVGITVSVGIADNKFLAKIASDWQKPDGLYQVESERTAEFAAALALKKIPGVGIKTAIKLQQDGLQYCQDILPFSRADLIVKYGRLGEMLYQRSRGNGSSELQLNRQRKSISVERTFAEDLTSVDDMLSALEELWQRLKQRSEQANIDVAALAPFVKVKFADFQQTTLSNQHLSINLKNYQELIIQAQQREPKAVRLLGIGGRCPEPLGSQLNLDF